MSHRGSTRWQAGVTTEVIDPEGCRWLIVGYGVREGFTVLKLRRGCGGFGVATSDVPVFADGSLHWEFQGAKKWA